MPWPFMHCAFLLVETKVTHVFVIKCYLNTVRFIYIVFFSILYASNPLIMFLVFSFFINKDVIIKKCSLSQGWPKLAQMSNSV